MASLALLLFRFSWDFVVEAYTALQTCRKDSQLASTGSTTVQYYCKTRALTGTAQELMHRHLTDAG